MFPAITETCREETYMCSYLFSNFEIKSYNSVNKSALLICSPISCSWINFFWNAFTIITFKLLNSHFFVLGFSHKKKKKKKILHPAICNTLNVIRTKILHVIGQLHQKFKVLTENWQTWYIGGADSKSRLRFLKFRHPKIHFWTNLVRKVVFFSWKLAQMVCRGCWFLFRHWLPAFPTRKSIFGQIFGKKFKVVRFAWKLSHMVSQRCG